MVSATQYKDVNMVEKVPGNSDTQYLVYDMVKKVPGIKHTHHLMLDSNTVSRNWTAKAVHPALCRMHATKKEVHRQSAHRNLMTENLEAQAETGMEKEKRFLAPISDIHTSVKMERSSRTSVPRRT